jgi:hypothetical protein
VSRDPQLGHARCASRKGGLRASAATGSSRSRRREAGGIDSEIDSSDFDVPVDILLGASRCNVRAGGHAPPSPKIAGAARATDSGEMHQRS